MSLFPLEENSNEEHLKIKCLIESARAGYLKCDWNTLPTETLQTMILLYRQELSSIAYTIKSDPTIYSCSFEHFLHFQKHLLNQTEKLLISMKKVIDILQQKT